jgi:hypothetical protein
MAGGAGHAAILMDSRAAHSSYVAGTVYVQGSRSRPGPRPTGGRCSGYPAPIGTNI